MKFYLVVFCVKKLLMIFFKWRGCTSYAPSHYYVCLPLLVVVDIQFGSALSCDLDYLGQELSLVFI